MKKQFLILGAVVLTLVVGLVYVQLVKPELDNRMVVVVAPMTMSSEELSFEFTYPSGENAFTLIEPPIPPETADGLQLVYLLMETKAYIDFQSAASVETPPTVSVFVLTPPESAYDAGGESRLSRLEAWAAQHPQYTAYNARTSETELVEIDGVQAMRYVAAGQYEQQVYLMGYSGNVYVFAGQYHDVTDTTKQMFDELIASVLFL